MVFLGQALNMCIEIIGLEIPIYGLASWKLVAIASNIRIAPLHFVGWQCLLWLSLVRARVPMQYKEEHLPPSS